MLCVVRFSVDFILISYIYLQIMRLICLLLILASALPPPHLAALTFTDCPFYHLQHLESSVSSDSSGADGVLAAIFSIIGTTENKTYVEISAGGMQYLHVLKNILGFTSLLQDDTFLANMARLGDFNERLIEQQVPAIFDLLHVKYGMSTWWILASVLQQQYRPRVVMAEVNSMLGCRDEVR
jgi:hypothetical protein